MTISAKTDKSKSSLVKYSMNYDKLFISAVTEFEVINGATPGQLEFWNDMLTGLIILDFDSKAGTPIRLYCTAIKSQT